MRGLLSLAPALDVMIRPVHALEPLCFGQIEGWLEDDLSDAIDPLRQSCAVLLRDADIFRGKPSYGGEPRHWQEACHAALLETDMRHWLETYFRPFRVKDPDRPEGLFTGYYVPECEGRRQRTGDFTVPLFRVPPDLVVFDDDQRRASGLPSGRIVNGRPQPYLTRKEIDSGALANQGLEIAWVRDRADAYFMQVQGSGRLRLEDGSILHLGFAAKSGLPYTSIGPLLVARGILRRENLSMQAIRRWMTENPEHALQLMWENDSFVFFDVVPADLASRGPLGAGRVVLTPERSIAVDNTIWMYGTPVWLATEVPMRDHPVKRPFRRLLIAQDAGSAIRGLARGDVFWGTGEKAAHTAGHMKSPGTMIVLLPCPLAASLGFTT